MAATTTPAFSGIPAQTFEFLRELGNHNNREWFAEHRTEYDKYYVEPGLALAAALGPRIQTFAPSVRFDPNLNGSMLRIYRDVRFSKDKTPYKTNLDLWFWAGGDKTFTVPGFFMRIEADTLALGAGMHHFPREMIEVYRAAVLDPVKGTQLTKALEEVRKAGVVDLGGATRKTLPRGVDPNHPRAQLLLHESLHAGWEGPIPPEASSAKLVDYSAARFKTLWPLVRWIESIVP